MYIRRYCFFSLSTSFHFLFVCSLFSTKCCFMKFFQVIKLNEYTFSGGNYVALMFGFPSGKKSALKGNNFLAHRVRNSGILP